LSSSKLITPRTLKGFRDYLPEAMIPRQRLIDTARRVYESYGFSPIDTPALEYLEILSGKGGDETDKQLYKFQDHGGRWVGLRFDLTVPLARLAAQHISKLGTPFKRYHVASVWRGENTQRGRYREFMQCDFDTIGTRSVAADVETALVIHDLLRAIGFDQFTIRINNRKVLSGLLERLDLPDRGTQILRSLDKLAKIGPGRVADEMINTAGVTHEQASEVLRLAAVTGTADQVLSALEPLVAGSQTGAEGLARLADVAAGIRAAGDALPGIGSICSGGRYDNLAELYTKQQLPGIGASLGLDRMLAAMEELGMIEKVCTPADVFIAYFDKDRLHDYLRLAAAIRTAGIGVEVFPDPKKLGQQLKYADRRGFRLALIAGSNEFDSGTCQIKDLEKGQQRDVPLEPDAAGLIAAIREILGS